MSGRMGVRGRYVGEEEGEGLVLYVGEEGGGGLVCRGGEGWWLEGEGME